MSTLQNLPPGPSKYWSNAVANAALLPASGAAIGECRLTIDTKRIYEWNGTAWVVIGSGSGGDVLAANVAAITSNAVVFAASASLSGDYANLFWVPSTHSGGVATGGISSGTWYVSSARFNGNIGLYGRTPTPQYAPTGASGFTQNPSAVPAYDTSTSSGGLGSSQVGWGDVVKALKLNGILRM